MTGQWKELFVGTGLAVGFLGVAATVLAAALVINNSPDTAWVLATPLVIWVLGPYAVLWILFRSAGDSKFVIWVALVSSLLVGGAASAVYIPLLLRNGPTPRDPLFEALAFAQWLVVAVSGLIVYLRRRTGS